MMRTVRRHLVRACWPLLLLGAACSVLDETWLSAEPLEGKQAREVHAYFAGNTSFTGRSLRIAVRPDMVGLSQGLDAEAAAFDAADALVEYYRSQGFPDASVTFRVEGPTERNGEPELFIVHFKVVEGPAVTIGRLQIAGHDHFAEQELLPLWSRRLSGVLGLGKPYFVHADLRAFAQSIRDFYRRRGFLEIEVEGPDVVRAPGAETATVQLRVSEGRQYRFGVVSIPEPIREALGDQLPPLPSGEVFSAMRTQQLLLALRSGLLKRGHPEPKIGMAPLPDVTALAEPSIDITVRGEPGPKAKYGPVSVTGNERTNTSVITGKLHFAEGQPFDGLKEQQAEEKLYRTGLFKRVKLEHGAIADGAMPVNVKVEETEAQSIELLAGFGSYEKLRGSARWEDRNLFGTGRELAIEGRASQRGYRASATLTDRDLFDSDVIGSLGGEAYEREYPAYDDQAVGGTLAFRRNLTEQLSARVGYGYQKHDTTTRVQGTAPPVEDYTDGSVFVELRRDTRDNIVLPNSGTAAYLRTDVTNQVFGADLAFNRVRAGLAVILALGPDTHLGCNLEAGGLWPGEGSASIPVSELFFNGGYNSVRSFKQDRLGPKDAAGTPTGGEYRNLLSIELRQRLYGPLELCLFGDAGNVGVQVQDYSFDAMSYALGAGLRLQLPIGPVRVDAGWNPDRNPGEDRLVVHLAVGYPF